MAYRCQSCNQFCSIEPEEPEVDSVRCPACGSGNYQVGFPDGERPAVAYDSEERTEMGRMAMSVPLVCKDCKHSWPRTEYVERAVSE